MNNNYKVTTFYDNRSDKGRIMMKVTINRIRFDVSLKIACTRYDYDKAMTGRMLNDKQKLLKNNGAIYRKS